jgi:hypothetical protein
VKLQRHQFCLILWDDPKSDITVHVTPSNRGSTSLHTADLHSPSTHARKPLAHGWLKIWDRKCTSGITGTVKCYQSGIKRTQEALLPAKGGIIWALVKLITIMDWHPSNMIKSTDSYTFKEITHKARWYIPVIPACGRQKQEESRVQD